MIDQELLTYLAEMESRIIGAIICEREPEPKPPESFDLVEAAKFLAMVAEQLHQPWHRP